MIYELLKSGAENGKRRELLMIEAGISNERAFRDQVRKERKEGKAILSSSAHTGFYKPSKDSIQAADEISAFVRECYSRANEIIKIANAINKNKEHYIFGDDSDEII